MIIIHDKQLGDIEVIRSNRSSSKISFRVTPQGTLRVHTSKLIPKILIHKFINENISSINSLIDQHKNKAFFFEDGLKIGKSHVISVIESTNISKTLVTTLNNTIYVKTKTGTLKTKAVQDQIREKALEAFRKEAKTYLPKRLKYFASTFDFNYKKVKLSHASSRWGSCSSRGTISLNIALMKLEFPLIDYVIIHELCHTRHMNHSKAFWQEVSKYDPNYKMHQDILKTKSPTI